MNVIAIYIFIISSSQDNHLQELYDRYKIDIFDITEQELRLLQED